MASQAVAGKTDLIFFGGALVLFVWIAIDPRRSLRVLLWNYQGPLSNERIEVLRALAAFVAISLALQIVSAHW